MARLINGSTRDISYTIAEMFLMYITELVQAEVYAIEQDTRYYGESLYETQEGVELARRWELAQECQLIIKSPQWKNLMDQLALKLEYYFLGIEVPKGLTPFGPSDACEKWARNLLKIAVMKDLHARTQYEQQSFLDAGNVKRVSGIGAYIEHHAPPPQIEGPAPMTLLELADSYEKVYQDSYAPVLPTAEAMKQLAPGGLFD